MSRLELGSRSKITGIGPKRAEIIVAGVAVLHEVMRTFGLQRLYYSMAGVRDGIIADLAHRRVGSAPDQLDADQRRVVRALGRRYGISPAHARKVAQLAAKLFDALHPCTGLAPAYGRMLASLRVFVQHRPLRERFAAPQALALPGSEFGPAGFQRHANAWESRICADITASPCRSRRTPIFRRWMSETRDAVVFLAPLLRIAVALDQSQEQKVENVEASIQDRSPLDKTVELRLVSEQRYRYRAMACQCRWRKCFIKSTGGSLVIRAKR